MNINPCLLVQQAEELVGRSGANDLREYFSHKSVERLRILSEVAALENSLGIGQVVLAQLEI